MKKDEFIREIVEIAKENEIKLSQTNVKNTIDMMELALDRIVDRKDSVNVMGYKFYGKEQAARTGKINVGVRKGETYTSPKKLVVGVKVLNSKKKQLEKEI